MSIQAITWAFKQQVESSNLKFILICFANYANEYGMTWCSTETIVAMTSMNRKTVLKYTAELERIGVLVDTGQREGKTHSIKIYSIAAYEANPKMGQLVSSPKITPEAVPNLTGSSPKLGNPPAPPIKINLKEPKGTIKKKSEMISLADWEMKIGSKLCVQMLSDWIKEKGAGATQIAELIEEFRLEMQSKDKRYADFKTTFQVWLTKGYLSKTLAQVCTAGRRPSGEVQMFDKGVAL